MADRVMAGNRLFATMKPLFMALKILGILNMDLSNRKCKDCSVPWIIYSVLVKLVLWYESIRMLIALVIETPDASLIATRTLLLAWLISANLMTNIIAFKAKNFCKLFNAWGTGYIGEENFSYRKQVVFLMVVVFGSSAFAVLVTTLSTFGTTISKRMSDVLGSFPFPSNAKPPLPYAIFRDVTFMYLGLTSNIIHGIFFICCYVIKQELQRFTEKLTESLDDGRLTEEIEEMRQTYEKRLDLVKHTNSVYSTILLIAVANELSSACFSIYLFIRGYDMDIAIFLLVFDYILLTGTFIAGVFVNDWVMHI